MGTRDNPPTYDEEEFGKEYEKIMREFDGSYVTAK